MMERYKLEIVKSCGDQYIRCEPAPDGSWVMVKDVAALQARIAELKAALRVYECSGKCANCYGAVRNTKYCGQIARAAQEGKP